MISCIVYGEPSPSVRWYRDTMVLARNENRRTEQFGIRHRLVISSVSEEEFGNYSCLAENELGKSRGFIELSGEKKGYTNHLNLLSLNIKIRFEEKCKLIAGYICNNPLKFPLMR